MATGTLYKQVIGAALSLHLLAWYLFYLAFSFSSIAWKCIGLGILGGLSLFLSLIYVWALSQHPSQRQTFSALSFHILIDLVVKVSCHFTFDKLNKSWKSPREYQERLLQEIIKLNGNTEYGKRFRLQEMASLADFQKQHPLTRYEHYRGYVDRMMEGEERVITGKTPTSYLRTTGTTGKPKYIPHTSKSEFLSKAGIAMFITLRRNHPGIGSLKKTMYIYVAPKVSQAKSGALIETIGRLPTENGLFFSSYTSPIEAFKIHTGYEANYIHLLFGMRDRDIRMIMSGFVSVLLSALKQLKLCWREIVQDMENGTINSKLHLPTEIRSGLSEAFGDGDPKRARELRREFEKGFTGIVNRIWPSLQVVFAIDSTGVWPKVDGSFSQGVPLFTSGFGCTEGFLGANLGPKLSDVDGIIPLPSVVVSEFIRYEDVDKEQPRTYLMDELTQDECYEVVLTNGYSGLYRYRLGDVFRVAGFYHNSPILKFMFRIGQILNLKYEKMDQKVLDASIRAAVARWSWCDSLTDYAVAESTLLTDDSSGEENPYYLIFLELETTSQSPSLTQSEKDKVDEELRNRNCDYDRLRGEGSISHPRIHLVRPGGFDALRDYVLQNTGATANQYKTPRKLRTMAMVDVLKDHDEKN